jgi:hypothetical protein
VLLLLLLPESICSLLMLQVMQGPAQLLTSLSVFAFALLLYCCCTVVVPPHYWYRTY